MRFHIRHFIDLTIQAMPIYTRRGSVVTQRKLKDISEGGLCFKSKVSIAKGTVLHFRIPVQQPAFEAKGQVSWCRLNNSYYDIGVEFERNSVDKMLKMVGQVCELKRYVRLEKKKGREISIDQAAMECLMDYVEITKKEVA